MICDCGDGQRYDYATQGGPETDSAICAVCAWSASGPHSDHAGYHHHLETGHLWRLFRRDTLT